MPRRMSGDDNDSPMMPCGRNRSGATFLALKAMSSLWCGPERRSETLSPLTWTTHSFTSKVALAYSTLITASSHDMLAPRPRRKKSPSQVPLTSFQPAGGRRRLGAGGSVWGYVSARACATGVELVQLVRPEGDVEELSLGPSDPRHQVSRGDGAAFRLDVDCEVGGGEEGEEGAVLASEVGTSMHELQVGLQAALARG